MVLTPCVARTSCGVHREGDQSWIIRTGKAQVAELLFNPIHEGVDSIEPVQHGLATSHTRHPQELPTLHIEESTVYENGGVVPLAVIATLEGMKIRPNLDGELPLVRPSLPSLRAGLMLQSHDLAIFPTDEVEFHRYVAFRPHRNHPTNFGIQHFDLIRVAGVLPGILSQSKERIVGSFPFEPTISRLRQLFAVQREELLISWAEFTEASGDTNRFAEAHRQREQPAS